MGFSRLKGGIITGEYCIMEGSRVDVAVSYGVG